jgi:alpha-tubulin suppressor-like RCC1 family protein
MLGSGASLTLRAAAMDSMGDAVPDSVLAWTTRDANRVTVDSTGFVMGLDTGSAYLVVEGAGVLDSALITVRLLAFTSVQAGFSHTCGFTTGGDLYCWGYGAAGQLGNGTTSNAHGPVRVASQVPFVRVSPGGHHTCARTAAGELHCWGNNAVGQLGTGVADNGTHALPVRAAVDLLFSDVQAGDEHTCGVTNNGSAFCWGWGANGRLGTRAFGYTNPTPLAVAGALSFRTVGAGFAHNCGHAADSTVYCWGDPFFGALGVSPVPTSCNIGGCPEPVAITGGYHFAHLAVGAFSACGLTADSAAYCWGAEISLEDVPDLVLGGLAFRSVTAGAYHWCGLSGPGQAYCWGANGQGELGSGDSGSHAPLLVDGGHAFANVSAGFGYTCGVTTSNVAYCWGSNGWGRAGLSQNIPSSQAPAKVLGQP